MDHRSKSRREEGLIPGVAVGWSGRWGRCVYPMRRGVVEREEQRMAPSLLLEVTCCWMFLSVRHCVQKAE